MRERARIAVVGVGNDIRRDDGVGWAVVSRLRERSLPPGTVLATCDGDPGRLIGLWEGAALAVVVDAAHAHPGRPAGCTASNSTPAGSHRRRPPARTVSASARRSNSPGSWAGCRSTSSCTPWRAPTGRSAPGCHRRSRRRCRGWPGNSLMELIGGRAIHPVNVRLGGFHRVPARDELRPLRDELKRALDDAWATVRWVAGFEFPDAHTDADLLALATEDTYAIEGGAPTVLRADGTTGSFPVRDFSEHVRETHVRHSTALHSRLDGRLHLTGSLARFAIGGRRLSSVARQAAVEAGLGDPYERAVCRNPHRSILVRAVEVVYALDEALRIITAYEPPARPHTEVPPVAGVGHGATEAPRGLLYHRYELTADGLVADARMVPPTAQNQGAIEDDLRRLAQRAITEQDVDDEELTHLCERAIRNHDPCISCSTHFLDLTVVRTRGGRDA